jgi:hypothetical protein
MRTTRKEARERAYSISCAQSVEEVFDIHAAGAVGVEVALVADAAARQPVALAVAVLLVAVVKSGASLGVGELDLEALRLGDAVTEIEIEDAARRFTIGLGVEALTVNRGKRRRRRRREMRKEGGRRGR